MDGMSASSRVRCVYRPDYSCCDCEMGGSRESKGIQYKTQKGLLVGSGRCDECENDMMTLNYQIETELGCGTLFM